MGITANTNISSIAASRALYESRTDLTQAMERLSSGKRINSSRDDAAGQTVVSRMRAQITSLNQAIRNASPRRIKPQRRRLQLIETKRRSITGVESDLECFSATR